MAKSKKSKSKSKGKAKKKSHPQRARFKKAAIACQAEVRDAGITAFSTGKNGQYKTFGRCMSKKLK